jgi:hypothetical protein
MERGKKLLKVTLSPLLLDVGLRGTVFRTEVSG